MKPGETEEEYKARMRKWYQKLATNAAFESLLDDDSSKISDAPTEEKDALKEEKKDC
jgi:hypothetical protein